jgi:hypothetical protein
MASGTTCSASYQVEPFSAVTFALNACVEPSRVTHVSFFSVILYVCFIGVEPEIESIQCPDPFLPSMSKDGCVLPCPSPAYSEGARVLNIVGTVSAYSFEMQALNSVLSRRGVHADVGCSISCCICRFHPQLFHGYDVSISASSKSYHSLLPLNNSLWC